MKRVILFLAAMAMAGLVQAAGLPFAVESLEKARTLAKQDVSKHVLVFYTSEN